VYDELLPTNAIHFLSTRQRCAIANHEYYSQGRCLDDLNKLSNSGSPIAQYIHDVRSWGSDVVVWWAGHGQLLIRSTSCPTCHVQIYHSVAHMDGVSNESTKIISITTRSQWDITYP
jgi:hypothetical protein